MIVLSLLHDGGPLTWTIVALGNAAVVWGAVNLGLVRDRLILTLQPLFALVPALLGAVGVLGGVRDFQTLATSATGARPAELAAGVAAGYACGFWGAAMTILGVALGVAALSRHAARWAAPPPTGGE